jgi:chaperonin GroES
MRLEPIGDRILVKVQEGETITKGGIYIPQAAQEKMQEGFVIAISKEIINKTEIQHGAKVMYDKYAGTLLRIEGITHLVLKLSDVLAIIKED